MIALSIPKIARRIPYKRLVVFIQKRPFVSFFTALFILMLLIVSGNVMRSLSRKPELNPETIKSVQTYTIGDKPVVSVQAQIEKYGVARIIAQTAGIVQVIHV